MAFDIDYDNSAAVSGSEAYGAKWQAQAADFRDSLGQRARLGVPYGATAREKADLFLPEGTATGLTIFVHGGYWRSRHRHDWSHFAAGALARGDLVAMPSYTLAPEARIARITLQVAHAVAQLADEVPDLPIRLVGHSAGGHLVARMMAADVMLPEAVADRLTHVMPISPVSDLRPLVGLKLNEDLRLDEAEAESESPALLPRVRGTPATVWVGAAELPAFVDQARSLAEAWDVPLVQAEGRHHFDVIEPLLDADSEMLERLFAV
ncbi:alpha/beta hydrolase fold protein [Rhodobacteraceae bacterium THAF1]|uniref:alpha/beta hydrolase n=1 Tax=Palleronia sp. THAF1 TaxID=2587842 RepID=UPI000F3C653E|nr:alpha/beta hydrolase [Palleronia sp. THAF1]QFU07509.1 alpha/beta hydrolase fold protein [Palleronia sp. THAF1]VDC20472.1 alpha/beta hydrolase fold protein [Rhodobacteraceae bacterium THAF1]